MFGPDHWFRLLELLVANRIPASWSSSLMPVSDRMRPMPLA